MNNAAPRPRMQPVKSAALKAIGHDASRNELHVDFDNGQLWAYSDVSPELYERLRQAESIGSFFHRNIKQVCKARKL